MLGPSIEAIINFCNKRYSINKRDMGTLIGFNNNPSLIFKDINLGEIDEIKNKCITHLSPGGGTSFLNVFKEASRILNNINGNHYHKIIILLSDGLDNKPDDTKNYIRNGVG